jgi:hypothetical protein
MSDNRCATGTTGIVWKAARKRLVDARPARVVATVAAVTGPAAAEGRIRGGDKLVAVFRPAADGDVPKEHGSSDASPAKAAQRRCTVRVCVVDSDLARVRQLLEGRAGDSVVLEFLRAAECCPSDAALEEVHYRKPRNTFTVRLRLEPMYVCVCACVYVCMHACMCVCVRARACVHVRVCAKIPTLPASKRCILSVMCALHRKETLLSGKGPTYMARRDAFCPCASCTFRHVMMHHTTSQTRSP